MRTASQIKKDLLLALGNVGDQPFASMDFKRRGNSLKYARIVGDTRQFICFDGDYRPKYRNDKELCILPHLRLSIESVRDAALKMVDGNKLLLANSAENIVNQPIELAAPKADRVSWYASGIDEMETRVAEISEFVRKWVRPFLDDLTEPRDIIRIYESRDDRMLKQKHWYLYVAAAELVGGNRKKAQAVLEKELGAPGLRRRYATAFESLGLTL